MVVKSVLNHLLFYNAVRCTSLTKKGSLSCHYSSVLDFAQGVLHVSHVSRVFKFGAVSLTQGLVEMYSLSKEGKKKMLNS